MGKLRLTKQEEAFALLIAEGKTNSEAYRGAYSTNKMKYETVNNNGYMKANKSDIKARVAELKEQLDKRNLITREGMLLDMMNIRNVNIMDMVACIDDIDGIEVIKWKDPSEWTKDQRRAVKAIKNTAVGMQIEFHDIVQINDRIAKMLGWDAPTKHEVKKVSKFAERTDEEIKESLKKKLMGRDFLNDK